MSTIASPRDPSFRRTPNSSARPSIDSHRSAVTSPINHTNPTQPPPSNQSGPSTPTASSSGAAAGTAGSKRSHRAALREYYNLRAAGTPRIELPDSEVAPDADIDAPNFDADEFVSRVVKESSLEDLLRLYTRVLGEVRALDAEKKALVYDNYSKLITATETIRKMRASMDPLNPMASTLDPAIVQIYSQATSIRDTLRQSVPSPDSEEGKRREAEQRKRRTQELAVEVLAMPDRLRTLVKEGKLAEAQKQWERPRKLLVSWKEKGLGGDEVRACIEEGDAALNQDESESDETEPSSDGR